ncbi:MAG: helix-turn-helix domain-containing protein [Solirubrobacteraceae bacterium]|nr:helix-turn-helix domain-containing protein [Solirubrobacteraceae bacterium]
MPPALEIGERLARARALRGWSQAALAEATGIDQSAIALYETGRRTARPGRVHELATALDVSASWLATGEGEPRPPASRSDLERIEAKLDEVLELLRETDHERENAVRDIEGIAGEPPHGK